MHQQWGGKLASLLTEDGLYLVLFKTFSLTTKQEANQCGYSIGTSNAAPEKKCYWVGTQGLKHVEKQKEKAGVGEEPHHRCLLPCSLLAAGKAKHPAVEGEKAAWEQGDSDTVVVPLRQDFGLVKLDPGKEPWCLYRWSRAAPVKLRGMTGVVPGAPWRIECLRRNSKSTSVILSPK